jgi:hypothetical protein
MSAQDHLTDLLAASEQAWVDQQAAGDTSALTTRHEHQARFLLEHGIQIGPPGAPKGIDPARLMKVYLEILNSDRFFFITERTPHGAEFWAAVAEACAE